MSNDGTGLRERLLAAADKAMDSGYETADSRLLREAAAALSAVAPPPVLEESVMAKRYAYALMLFDAAEADGMTAVAYSAQVPLHLLDKRPSEIAALLCENAHPATPAAPALHWERIDPTARWITHDFSVNQLPKYFCIKSAQPEGGDAVAVIAAEMRERGRSCGYELIRAWADRLAALPREAAPQASGGDELSARLQQQCGDWGTYWRAPDAHGVILSREQATELLRDALGVEVEITAPTDSAIQSQQGATGGADALLREVLDECAGIGCGPCVGSMAPFEDLCGRIERYLARPQAAGSAPGEAMQPQRSHGSMTTPEWIRNGPQPTNSAGSVASGAGHAVAVSWSDYWCRQGRSDVSHDYETFVLANEWRKANITPATAAGSAPVGVDAKELGRQLAAYRRMVNKLDDRIEYARESYTRAEIHTFLAELTAELASTKERAE